jgi:hypothetical protein
MACSLACRIPICVLLLFARYHVAKRYLVSEDIFVVECGAARVVFGRGNSSSCRRLWQQWQQQRRQAMAAVAAAVALATGVGLQNKTWLYGTD